MGDMGDIFRDGKEIKADHRRARATQAMQMIEDVKSKVDKLTIDDQGSWNIVKGRAKIQFYPTKGSWQYRNRMYKGNIHSFVDWLEAL